MTKTKEQKRRKGKDEDEHVETSKKEKRKKVGRGSDCKHGFLVAFKTLPSTDTRQAATGQTSEVL